MIYTKISYVSGGCSLRTVSISTPKRDQKISECSTRRSENQAKACKENQIVSSLYPVKFGRFFCENILSKY
jgi:hypothetical protein